VLRFSRLYPLHFVTLFLVAVAQIGFLRLTGSYFVYGVNDLRHFVLNLLFASSWGLERGYSFNGPNWSVSAEIAFYALFFVACRTLPIRVAALAGIALGGFLLSGVYAPIFRGGGLFFLGGCAFLCYRRIVAAGTARCFGLRLAAVVSIAWTLTVIVSAFESHGHPVLGPAADFLTGIHPLVGSAAAAAFRWWPALLFPVTILALALVETTLGNFTGRWAMLGDLSYSSYMLHFPLQLAAVALVTLLGISRTVFLSPWVLALFVAVLIAASWVSHRFIEVPAQRTLRLEALGRRVGDSGAAAP
jgi:peptidoglycan/LPS O-acetylase OafA/YrhL